MALLELTPDQVLTTTRSVRKRLDLTHPVPPEVIRECLEIAIQAPTGGNRQPWHFIVITDAEKRKAIGDLYRRGFSTYRKAQTAAGNPYPDNPQRTQVMRRIVNSSDYLAEHMHEVPVLVIPCIFGRTDGKPSVEQAGVWGSILPAAWSFMLAARVRGLGSAWTTLHLPYEREAAQVLGIPYEKIMQTALIPVAYTIGDDFKPASREPLDTVVHWDQW